MYDNPLAQYACLRCGGSGQVMPTLPPGIWHVVLQPCTCPSCGGSGVQSRRCCCGCQCHDRTTTSTTFVPA